jgi:hypothetical protein
MDKFRVQYNPKDFKLTIRRNREKDQLVALKDWEFRRIEPCLSSVQRQYLVDYRASLNGDY